MGDEIFPELEYNPQWGTREYLYLVILVADMVHAFCHIISICLWQLVKLQWSVSLSFVWSFTRTFGEIFLRGDLEFFITRMTLIRFVSGFFKILYCIFNCFQDILSGSFFDTVENLRPLTRTSDLIWVNYHLEIY